MYIHTPCDFILVASVKREIRRSRSDVLEAVNERPHFRRPSPDDEPPTRRGRGEPLRVSLRLEITSLRPRTIISASEPRGYLILLA